MSQKNTRSPRVRKDAQTSDAHARFEAIWALLWKECDLASRDQCTALEMAKSGVLALVYKDEGALANAREWKAGRTKDDTLAIVDLTLEVGRAVQTRSKRDRSTRYPVELEPFVTRAADADAADERYAHAAEDAATDLRARLVARFSEAIPSVEKLERLLDRRTNARGRPRLDAVGRRTTDEIVYEIACAALLGGVNPKPELKQATLAQISKARRRRK